MKKLKNILSNNKFVAFTPIVAIIIFIVVFIIKSIIPIGKNTMLAVDFYHQYGPLLSELYDRIKSGSSLTYSFQTGLGLPFFRNFYNYLSSPFNVILLFFKRDNIVTAFSIIIALKIITASTTMAYTLKKFTNKDTIFTTIFGLSYAFSSYFVAFYWNIMWLDGLIYLPLITLGIKKLIDENKFNLYIISLAIAILSNYFIGYMLCIYSCIFFFVYLIFNTKITRKELLKKIGLFAISSIVSGGIVAFMLLPYMTSLSTISATGDKFVFTKNWNFNPLFFFANNYSAVKTIVFSSQDYFLPNISSGVLVFILVSLYFINKDIKLHKKIASIVLLLILFISFIYIPIDFIWHGFHIPNDLPFRYSFIFVFITNLIAYISATKLEKINIYHILAPILIIGIFAVYLYKIEFLSDQAFVINVVFIIVTLITTFMCGKKYESLLQVTFLCITILNIILNINANWNINHDKNTFMDNYVQTNYAIETIKNQDKDFYRIEKANSQTLNDGAWYNYNGVSIFSSVAYENMAKTQKKLGIPGNNVNSYYYRQNTPIYNSIMSIKYILNLNNTNSYYEYVDNINENKIYKNDYYLPIAFATNKELKNWKTNYNDPFINQQEFVYKATDIENIFNKLDIVKQNEEDDYFVNERQLQNTNGKTQTALLKIVVPETGNVYLYAYNYYLEHYLVNGNYQFITKNEPYIVDIGYFEKDEEINIEIQLNKDVQYVDLYAYQLDNEKFHKFYYVLNNESIEIKKFKETEIEGTLTALEDRTVFTSIAYDEGFEVYVDNKKTKTYPIAKSFLGFDITEGTHNIKIKYKIPKLKIGIILTIISAGIFTLMNIIKNKKKSK